MHVDIPDSSSLAKSMSSELPLLVTMEPHSFASIVYDVMTIEYAARELAMVTWSFRLLWYSRTFVF
jgi:hypothetical protein